MQHFFKDYYWKDGKPYGLEKTEVIIGRLFKIVSDPYYKRISIESYQDGFFEKVIYDSLFLDFRKLKPMNQIAWERETLYQNATSMKCLLRDECHRAILIENYVIQEGVTLKCEIRSVHGIEIGTQSLYYTARNDPFNGVILFDNLLKPVMKKSYEVEDSYEFTELIQEEWEFKHESTAI